MPFSLPATRRYLISTTTLLWGAMAVAGPALAFNPDEGAIPPASAAKRLPDTAVLAAAATPAAPLYPSGHVTPSGYISPLSPVHMPTRPLYPERSAATPVSSPMAVSAPMVAPAPVMATAPGLPPVDPEVAAKARAMLAAENSAQHTPAPAAAPTQVAQPLAAPASGFVAPAPVFAIPATATPVPAAAPATAVAPAPRPAVVATPVTTAPAPVAAAMPAPMPVAAAVPPAPAAELSDETRTILSRVPAAIDAPRVQTASLKMDRVDPEIKELLGQQAQEDSFEAVGLSIKVRRPGLDTNYELNRAYTALMGGDTQTAITTYKNILGQEPRNVDALFGLAATYHRLGMIDQARPFYGMLLQVDPNHREGLNNFLVLVSDESPQDALPELERLEARNPDFSPIPAQIAIVLDKMGYADASREKMLRAIELAPDNMTYKYNLAVMLDQRGDHANAAALYRSLIEASLRGAAVPASLEAMQKRLNYIVTAMTNARTAMGK